jgi:hypothetical protein
MPFIPPVKIFFNYEIISDFLFLILTQTPLVRISARDPNGISKASFRASRPTKLFIHGWRATGFEGRILVNQFISYLFHLTTTWNNKI